MREPINLPEAELIPDLRASGYKTTGELHTLALESMKRVRDEELAKKAEAETHLVDAAMIASGRIQTRIQPRSSRLPNSRHKNPFPAMTDNPLKPSENALEARGGVYTAQDECSCLTLESYRAWLATAKASDWNTVCPKPTHISKLLPIHPNSIDLNHQEQSEPF